MKKECQPSTKALEVGSKPLQSIIEAIVPADKRSELGDALVKPVGSLIDWYNNLPEDQQRLLSDTGFIAEGVANAIIGGQVLKGVKTTTKSAMQNMQALKKTVDETITSGVKKIKPKVTELVSPPLEKVIEAEASGISNFLATEVSPQTKESLVKMFDIAEEIQGQFSPTKKVFEPIGENLAERVKFLSGKGSEAGAAKTAAIEAMPDTPIDITSTYNDIVDMLKSLDIDINKAGKLNFRKSKFKTSGTKFKAAMQDAINMIKPNNKGQVLRTPQRIDRIRQTIFEQLGAAKLEKKLTKGAEDIVGKIRDKLIEPLKVLDGELELGYIENAQKFAQTRKALMGFLKKLGLKDIPDDLSLIEKRASEVSRRIRGNAAALVEREVDPIVALSEEFGFTGPDIKQQVDFALFLERLFKLTEKTNQASLSGQVQSAVEASNLIKDVATGRFGEAALKLLDKIQGKTPEDKIKALRELLTSTKSRPPR